MPSLQESISISAPTEKVWNIIEDFEARPSWAPRVIEVEILGGGPLREGSDIRIQVGKRSFIPRVVELRPNERLVLRVGGVSVKAHHIYEVSPEGDGTKLSLTARYGGVMGVVIGFLLKKSVRRDLENELSALKKAVEFDADQD